MHNYQQIIDTLRPFAHRTDVQRIEEAIQALRPFGDEAVLALADASRDPDDIVPFVANSPFMSFFYADG